MTENKRFTVKQRQGATNYSIEDYYGELPLSEGMYYKSNAEKLCKWLNTQHELLNTLYDENEQLKLDLKVANDGADLYKDINEALEKENEQLKQFIQELTTKGTAKIHLANGSIYKVDAILTDFKG